MQSDARLYRGMSDYKTSLAHDQRKSMTGQPQWLIDEQLLQCPPK